MRSRRPWAAPQGAAREGGDGVVRGPPRREPDDADDRRVVGGVDRHPGTHGVAEEHHRHVAVGGPDLVERPPGVGHRAGAAVPPALPVAREPHADAGLVGPRRRSRAAATRPGATTRSSSRWPGPTGACPRAGPGPSLAGRPGTSYVVRRGSVTTLLRSGRRGGRLDGSCGACGGRSVGADALGRGSVASSSCLTSRKSHTIAEAPSIISEPTRNAFVAPSVKTRARRAGRAPRSRAAERRPRWPRAISSARVCGSRSDDRAERRQAERATHLLHRVEHAGPDAGVLRAQVVHGDEGEGHEVEPHAEGHQHHERQDLGPVADVAAQRHALAAHRRGERAEIDAGSSGTVIG